jgi:hypothetical protein
MAVASRGATAVPVDGRQSERAADIARGVTRLLAMHGFACVCELPLANGRRADVAALSDAGEIWIVEIKSCLEDFRTDQKWPEYREFCDRLLFAVAADFPREVLPADTGLVIADRYGGELARAAPEHRLAGARRKAVSLRFARVAALRLSALFDPEAGLELPVRE